MTTRVWERYGRLRIYVHSGELEVGWSEPRTGRFLITRPGMAALFWADVEAECQRLTQAGRLASPVLGDGTAGPQDAGGLLPVRRAWVAAPPRPAGRQPDGRRATRSPPAAPLRSVFQPAPGSSAQTSLASLDSPVTPPSAATPPSPAALVPAPRSGERAEPGGLPPSGARSPDPHWVVRDPAWDDLASNRPGSAASERARQLRRERPVLSVAADLLGGRSMARSFAIGARGERTVGRALDKWAARYGWHVLHAVPVGRNGTDIDHVVIGSFGVVTINTKTSGTAVWVGEYGMTVGGKTVDYLGKSRGEARRARRLLAAATGADVPVASVIVFAGVRTFTMVRGGPPDVAVLRSPRALRRWLRRQPAALSERVVESVYDAARRPASWQAGAPRDRRR